MKKLLAVVVFAALAAGCSSQGNTPAATVFAAHTAYDAALTGAVAYKKLPDCASTTMKICSDKGAVATIQKADIVAFDALSRAQAIVRQPEATKTSLETAAMWAREAIAAFSKLVASLDTK